MRKYFYSREFPGITINGLPDDYKIVKKDNNKVYIHWGEQFIHDGEEKHVHNLTIGESVQYERLISITGKIIEQITYNPLPESEPKMIPGTKVTIVVKIVKKQ